MDFRKELDGYIASNYPLLALVTHEETRANINIQEVASRLNKKFYIWSIISGLNEIKKSEDNKEGEVLIPISDGAVKDPQKLLQFLSGDDIDDEAIFVLSDFNYFFRDVKIQRYIRELVDRLTEKLQTIIFLGPVFTPPADISREITEMEFPLPTHKENKLLLAGMAESCDTKVDNKEVEKILDAASGLASNEVENALAKSFHEKKKFDPATIIRVKAQTLKKGLLEYYQPDETMEDIGGFPAFKLWLELRKAAFTQAARDFGIRTPKGVLITGIPGTGKSLACKAISNLWVLPLLRLDVGKVFGSLVGDSERNMRDVLKIAETMAPSILWIDEIEKGLAGMQSSGKTDSGVAARVFGTLLTWMQEKKDSVFVVATSNNISILPPELLRKGRFDELFWVDLPTGEERKDIFRIHIRKVNRDSKKFDLEKLVVKAKGFTGSEIEEVVNSSLFIAFSEKTELKTKHMMDVISKTVPLSITMKEQITAIKNWAKDRAVNVGSTCDLKIAKKLMGRNVSGAN